MNNQSKNFPVTRKSFLRLLALTLMASIFILPVKINAQGTKANFSGTWTLNEGKVLCHRVAAEDREWVAENLL